MTKRDYQMIAGAIKLARDDRKCSPDELWGIDIAATIARDLGDDNPRFDGLTFLRACGFSDDVIGGRR